MELGVWTGENWRIWDLQTPIFKNRGKSIFKIESTFFKVGLRFCEFFGKIETESRFCREKLRIFWEKLRIFSQKRGFFWGFWPQKMGQKSTKMVDFGGIWGAWGQKWGSKKEPKLENPFFPKIRTLRSSLLRSSIYKSGSQVLFTYGFSKNDRLNSLLRELSY